MGTRGNVKTERAYQMAMTKAEKARVEELETALALCWPPYPAPEPMTREEIEAAKIKLTPRDASVYRNGREAALGWFYNAYAGLVTQGWSDGMSHSVNNTTGDYGSQRMGQMYRTRAEAAMAMRIEMSREFAKKLAAVDRVIAGAEG